MTIFMDDSHLVSMAQLIELLQLGGGVDFTSASRAETYRWMNTILRRFRYISVRKKEKTIIKKYIMKMTGYSDAQITRLIKKKKTFGNIVVKKMERHTFEKKYTTSDVARLIEVDIAHGRLNGHATKNIFEREFTVYGKPEFARIQGMSVSHIYNLRKTNQYRSQAGTFTKTTSVQTPIGERRKPENNGQPGCIRVDTVHQGDMTDCEGKSVKGVYHINLTDEVTQWEYIGSVEGISERFLAPVLEALIEQFPFTIINFHSDNGSEYINRVVQQLLTKMFIAQTKSRPRHSNDNGLAETKNGAIIRKHMGYAYIPQRHAAKINHFYHDFMNPYLNFHRPCGYATDVADSKKPGKIKKVYDTYLTPFEKLKTIANVEQYLKPTVTITLLGQFAKQMSDTEAARGMQKAKLELFRSFRVPMQANKLVLETV